MNLCPKCKQEVPPQLEICPHCGIVFAKYQLYHRQPQSEQQPTTVIIHVDADGENRWSAMLTEDAYQQSQAAFVGRCLLLAVFLIWSWRLITPPIASNAVGESFLHAINLPFHEAGHIFFRPFGQFITSLGGTLGQLLMPAICMLTLLLKTRDPFGAALAFWWLGENFLDIAPYIDDARAGQLPLVGGNFGHSSPYGFHDWEYLLTESGLINHDHLLAKLSHLNGTLMMVTALLCCGYLLYKQRQALKSKQ